MTDSNLTAVPNPPENEDEFIEFDDEKVAREIGVAIIRSTHPTDDGGTCDKHLFIELTFVTDSGEIKQYVDVSSNAGMVFVSGALTDALARDLMNILAESGAFGPSL